MELTSYIRIFRRWFWLLIVGGILGAGVSFILTGQQVAVYRAQTTVSVGQFFQDPNPTTSQIYVGQNLVATYQQLVKTHDVLQGVVDALSLKLPAEALAGRISTSVIANTSLFIIQVANTDPVLAADIANELANQLIIHSPTNLTPEQQSTVDFAKQQIQTLSAQVAQQQDQKNQLDQQVANSNDTSQIQQWRSDESTLVTQINQAMTAIAQFQSTVSAYQQRTNAITVVDQATIPAAPDSRSSNSLILLGGAAGVAAALGIALLIEYLDDKIRTSDVASQLLSLPVLGAIPQLGKKKSTYHERLLTNYSSLSEITEAYRQLRTNFVYAIHNSSQKIVVVTSCGPAEGKSVTSANLAAAMALSGTRVLLVDADMRRPVLHEIFDLKNGVGLDDAAVRRSERLQRWQRVRKRGAYSAAPRSMSTADRDSQFAGDHQRLSAG